MAKLDKAELKKQAEILKQTIAQGRKKTLNFALLQGKDQMFLVTHLKKNPAMLRKEAKKEGGGPKAAMGTFHVEGKNLVFSVEDEPPGPFPKLTKKHFMARGIAIRVTFKLPDGTVLDDGEPDEQGSNPPAAPPATEEQKTPPEAEPETDSYADSIMGFFGDIKDDLEGKMAEAGDDAKGVFQELSDRFHKSYAAQLYDEAKGHLDDLKKKLEDVAEKVEETVEEIVESTVDLAKDVVDNVEDIADGAVEKAKDLKELPSDVQKRIDSVIEAGLTEADILQKSAEENAKQLVKNIIKNVSEAKDHLVELMKPATEKVAELIEIYQKYEIAKDQLKDMDLSDDQTKDLARLAVDHPKSFDAALAALKSMDGKFGDLVATPAGIADMRKKQAEKDKLVAAQNLICTDLSNKNDAAKKDFETAKKLEEETRKKIAATSAALVKLKSKLPSDLSKLTPAQKGALAKVIKLLQGQKKVLESAQADSAAKGVIFKTANEAFEAQDKILGVQLDERIKADEAIFVAETKKKMLDALNIGSLSPNTKNPMKDEDVAKILSAIAVDPELGNVALDLVETSKDKEHVAKGAAMLAKGVTNGFKDKDGNSFGTSENCAIYAADALRMGSALGGSYFEDLNGFVAEGGLTKPTSLSFNLTPKKKLEQERANYVSGAMLDGDGKIDTKSDKAVAAMNMVNFHPDLLAVATPGMNMHFADMAKTMEDPKHKQKIQDVLDGITTAPTEDTGRDLVAQATDKKPENVTKDDIKAAVMSAMFTPLDQGPVGSCFATGPSRNVRDKDPAKAMADMAEIASKGTFTTAQGVTIKAVKTNLGTTEAEKKLNKLPPDDNPLMRSWEYTVATAGAQLADSYEEETLDTQLWTVNADADPDGKNLNALKDLDGMANWAQVKADLKNLIHDELDFRYNATSKIKKSADGKSENGNFEIFNKGNEISPAGTITTKADFIKIISGLAIKAAKAEANAELSQKIKDHCSSDAFIDSVCLWKKGVGTEKDEIHKPWEIDGGGFAAPMIKVLEGGNPETKNVLGSNPESGKPGHESQGVRTKKVMGAIMTSFIAAGDDTEMLNLTTGGIHVFEGLPNHPSLDKLKEGDDPAAALDKYLLQPGKEMASKDMDADTSAVLFDRQIDAYAKFKVASGRRLRDDEKGIELIEAARTKRPSGGMTPKELKTLIDETLKPIIGYQLMTYAKSWKDAETAKGNAPSDEDVAKKAESYRDWADGKKDVTFDNTIINTLDPPEFVIADTNWGDGDKHVYFVVIPDPVSGEPKMFERSEPSGKLKAVGDKWLDTNWRVTK